MKHPKKIACPACGSAEQRHFISTSAMMHKQNEENYHFNQCASCQSVFLTNPVDENQLSIYYTKYYLPYKGADAWGAYKGFVERSQKQLDRRRAEFVVGALELTEDSQLLDVGCGNPSFLSNLQQKTNIKCTGIDFSDEGWKHQEFDSLHLIQSTFEAFESSQRFDAITLWHYLEHDYNLQETAKKLHSLLKPGGKLIIEVPDYKSITAKAQKQHWQGWHSPRHLTLFSKKGLQMLFPKSKWQIKKHLRYGTLDAFTLWWLGRMEKKQINWTKAMDKEFWPLVMLKLLSFPFFILEKFLPMGIQLLVLEKNETV